MPDSIHVFEAFGIEIEYPIVRTDDLSVLPVSDQLIYALAGEYVCEIELGELCLSNELSLHLIELKTNGPKKLNEELPPLFQETIKRINTLLAEQGAQLLPTGAHPFMDPLNETKLWPHDYNPIYERYHAVFDCRGHGWSNVQSTHLNLPFSGDEEFARLHTAIRLILPLIPALSASTPVIEGKKTGYLDSRLEFYRHNQQKIPSIAGLIIPEIITSEQEYQEKILKPIYRDIAPYDPDNILQYEWLNSRGAIARFERNAIEIRIIDAQECPQADIAIVSAIVAAIESVYSEKWLTYKQQRLWSEKRLAAILNSTIKEGGNAVIDDSAFLDAFGYTMECCTAGQLWRHISQQTMAAQDNLNKALKTILKEGPLAQRILAALGNDYSRKNITAVYRKLAQCLSNNILFTNKI